MPLDGADDVELAIQNSRRLQVITGNTLSQHIEDVTGDIFETVTGLVRRRYPAR